MIKLERVSDNEIKLLNEKGDYIIVSPRSGYISLYKLLESALDSPPDEKPTPRKRTPRKST